MHKQQISARETNKSNRRRALRASLRLNQPPMNWTRFTLQQTDLARNCQQGIARLFSITNGAVSISQRQVGQGLELIGRSIRVKADLLQQASVAAQAPSLSESQARWMDFWMAASHLAHSNANALARINGAALGSWLRLLGNHQ